MIRHLQSLARFGCAMIMLACASDEGPTAPESGSRNPAPPPSLSTEGAEPTPEELATLPPEFSEESTILAYDVEAGFSEGDGAFAEASMTYYATNAEQEATVTVRAGSTQIGTKTGRSVRHNFLPSTRTMHTIIGLPFAGACGHIADAKGQHKAWHQFFVVGWKFLTWGAKEEPSSNYARQRECEARTPRGGSGDDPYEGGCEVCQQWFYVFQDGTVAVWWDCWDVDSCRETL
jgi:hypothetical protein